MDAISLDDWELLLPDHDHKSSFFMDAECSNGIHGGVGGGKDQLLLGAELVVIDMDHFGPMSSHPPPAYDYCILDDEEAKKPLLPLASEDAYGRDPIAIDVVAPAEPERKELVSEVTGILVYRPDEETINSVEEADQDGDDDVLVEAADAPDGVSQCARDEEGEEEGFSKTTGFGVGNLRVNGVGALWSFGVASAMFCILLLGGKQQQLQKRQAGHKIQQLQQMYAGDERIQQVVVVQQASSILKETMSSVMGGASSARASIYYQGF